MTVEIGPPLSPHQEVEHVTRFNAEELGTAVFHAALEKAKVPFGQWTGHIAYEVHDGTISATAYIWKDELATLSKSEGKE